MNTYYGFCIFLITIFATTVPSSGSKTALRLSNKATDLRSSVFTANDLSRHRRWAWNAHTEQPALSFYKNRPGRQISRRSRRRDNEGLLKAQHVHAGHLSSKYLKAKRVRADRILSDNVDVGTLVVSKRRKSSRNRNRPERQEAVRTTDINRSLHREPSNSQKSKAVNTDGPDNRINVLHNQLTGRRSTGPMPLSVLNPNEDGLLRARKVMSRTIDTSSLTADRVLADRIRSDQIKTKDLRVTDKKNTKMSYYKHDVGSPNLKRESLSNNEKATEFIYDKPETPSMRQRFSRSDKTDAISIDFPFVDREDSFRYSGPTTSNANLRKSRKQIGYLQSRKKYSTKNVGSSFVRIEPRTEPKSFEVQYTTPYAFHAPDMQMFMEYPVQVQRISTPGITKRYYKVPPMVQDQNPVLPTVDHMQYINGEYDTYRKITDGFQFFK